MRDRLALGIDQQVLGAARKAEMRAGERLVGAEMLGPAMRRRMRLDRLRIRRLEAKAAGAIDRADQHLQHVQRARRLEAVGMGRDAAHGMERHRPADEAVMPLAVHVGPGLVDEDRLVEGDAGDLGGKPADRRRRRRRSRPRRPRAHISDRGIFRRAAGTTAPRSARRRARSGPTAPAARPSCRRDTARSVTVSKTSGLPSPSRANRPWSAVARRVDHQPGRVGVAHQIVDIDLARLEQFVDDREDQQPVGARPDADPVVGDRRIAGAHRIDRDEARAALLQLGDADLQRVGIMVLGDAEHDEELRPLPVRRAELPERAADRHDAGGRHVDRAEAAMRGIVRRAELLRPEAGQRLRLVAAGEEGELLRVGLRAPRRASRSPSPAPRPRRFP